MEKIEDTDSLWNRITNQTLGDDQWRKVGSVVRRFHQRGVFHADLNAHNILLDKSGEVYLIDFDKCRLRKTQRSWQLKNLNRLRRSLNKLKRGNDKVNFEEKDWQALLSGYTQL